MTDSSPSTQATASDRIQESNAGRVMFLAGSYSPPQSDPSSTFSSHFLGRVGTPDRRIAPALTKTTSRHNQPRKKISGPPLEKRPNRINFRPPSYLMKLEKKEAKISNKIDFEVQPAALDSLPTEIAFNIFEFLPPDEIVSFGLLNSRCFEYSRHPELWEHRLQFIHPILDLLDLEPTPLAERRSKGRVCLAHLKGTRRKFAVRSISLEMTNAGKDDGIPTSCLRELSLALTINNPHVLRCFGGSVEGSQLNIVSEYCGPSLLQFLADHSNLQPDLIKRFMGQLFSATAALHHRGIVHRNIKTDNVVVEQCKPLMASRIKLADLAMGRAIDFPLGMYTPEDPKERDRSFREQRRLYSRAPEIILRQPVYGLEVDIWSLGCLFVELALGTPPFRCETEIGLIMSTLQVCGTPDISLWDRLSSPPETFLKLPQWDPIDFRALALVLSDPDSKNSANSPVLPYEVQGEGVKTLLAFGSKVGIAGLHLLERLLILPGCFRVTAAEALTYPYFTSTNPDKHPEVLAWMNSWKKDQLVVQTLKPMEKHLYFFERFIHAKRPAHNVANPYKDAVKSMELRSLRVPARYDLVSSVPFDFAEELEKIKPSNSDFANLTPTPVPIFAVPQNSNTNLLTPAPRRSKRLLRRRRESATPTEIDVEESRVSVEEFSDRKANEEDNSDSSSDSYHSDDLSNCDSMDGDVEFEVEFPRLAMKHGNEIVNADSFESLLNDSTEELSSESIEESFHLSDGRRQKMALSQSPVNAKKLQNTDSNHQPKSWRQLFWLWGGNWERLADSRPPVKRSPAVCWISRNTRRDSAFLEKMLPGESRRSSVIQLPPCKLPRVSPRTRLDLANYLLGIQPELLLKSQTLHIAIGLLDRYSSFLIGHPDEFSAGDFIPVAVACLKIADLYNELSKEYYKQDNVAEYSDFTASPTNSFEELIDQKGRHLATIKVEPEELLAEEKLVLNTLRFEVLIPTVCWFVDVFLSTAKLLHLTHLVDYCHYLSDLSLFSHQLLAYRPSLTAQVVLLVACCSLFRPTRPKTETALEDDDPSSVSIIRSHEDDFVAPLETLLSHFIAQGDELCASNTVWEVLDCFAVFRDLLLDGRRYFERVGFRSLMKLHPWVTRYTIPTPTIPPSLARFILPSSQHGVLLSLS